MGAQTIGIKLSVTGGPQAVTIINSFNTSIKKLNASTASAVGPMAAFGNSISRAGKSVTSAGRSLTAGLTLPILGLGVAALKVGTDFETAFAGVSKTVEGVSTVTDGVFDGLTEEGERLRETILGLSKELPLTAAQLANIGEVAGQFGAKIGSGGASSEVAQMIEVLAKLAETTNIVSEGAQQKFAQIAAVAGLSADQFGNLASSIVFLGNNFATTETQIVNFANRLIGTGLAIGLTTDQVLGWGAAVTSSGIRAETGATAIRKAFQEMTLAVITSTVGIVDNTSAIEDAESTVTDLGSALAEATARQEALGDAMTPDAATALKEEIIDLTSEYEFQVGALDSLKDMHGQVFEGGSEQLQLFASIAETGLGVVREQYEASGLSAQEFADSVGLSVDVLDTLSLSGEEFAQLFKEDANGAMQLFLNGLSTLEGTEATAVLDKLNLGAQRVGATLQNVAADVEGLNAAMGGAAKAFATQDALNEEFAKRMSTLASMVGLLKNQIMAIGIAIFDLYSDDIKNLVNSLSDTIERFSAWSDAQKKTAIAIALIVAAIGPLIAAFGTALVVVGSMITAIAAISLPVLAAAVAIGSLIAAVVMIIGPENIFNFILEMTRRLPESIEEVRTKILDLIDAVGDIEFRGSTVENILPPGVLDEIEAFVSNIGTSMEEIPKIMNDLPGKISGSLSDDLFAATQASLDNMAARVKLQLEALGGVLLNIPEEVAIAAEAIDNLTGFSPEQLAGVQDFSDIFSGIPEKIEDVGAAFEEIGTLPPLTTEDMRGQLLELEGGVQRLGSAMSETEAPMSEMESNLLGIQAAAVPSAESLSAVEETAPGLSGVGSALGGIAGPAAAAASALSALLPEFKSSLLDAFGDSLESLRLSLDIVKGSLEGSTPSWLTFGNVVSTIATIIGVSLLVAATLVVTAVGIIVRVVAGVIAVIAGFFAVVSRALSGALELVGPAIDLVLSTFELLVAIVDGDVLAVKEALIGLGESFQNLFAAIDVVLLDILTIIGDTMIAIATAFLGEEALAKFEEFINGIIDFANDLFMELVGGSIFPDIMTGIIDVLGDLLTDGLALFGELTDGIIGLAEGVLDSVGDIFSGIFGGGGGAEGGGDLIDLESINAAKQAADDLSTSLGAISTSTGEMLTAFTTAITAMTTVLTLFGTKANTMWLRLTTSFTLMTALMREGWSVFTQFLAEDLSMFVESAMASMESLQASFTSVISSMSAAWDTFVSVMSAGAAAISASLAETASSAEMLGSSISSATSTATGNIQVLINAFFALANAARVSAAAVVAALASIAGAAAAATADATGSPELNLQHPFERFLNFMEDDFAPKVPNQIITALQPITSLGTSALVPASSAVSNTSNVDNSVGVNVTGSSSPIDTAIDTLRDIQQTR